VKSILFAALCASACVTAQIDGKIGEVSLKPEESSVLVDSMKQSELTRNLSVQSISCLLELQVARCSARNESFGERIKIEPVIANQLAKLMLRYGARLPGENAQGGVRLKAEAVRCDDRSAPRCTLIVGAN
jgi:hypothetical protein